MQMTKVEMDAQTQKNIEMWLEGSYSDASKSAIRKLQKENPLELIDAFYKRLDFGTGGLRGLMGVGTNRMNEYTVRAATQGLANYLATQPKEHGKHTVLIGYDCRNNSRFFAEETAKVLAANDIGVFLFAQVTSVSLISFGVLHKKCSAGIMITASHNPPEYNGYKVWWSDGVQVLPPHDHGIIAEVNKIEDLASIKMTDLTSPLVQQLGDEIEKAYLKALHELQLHPAENRSQGKNLKVIYTNLHGDGIVIVPKVLADWGFVNVTLVDEQKAPDGNFPTIKSPNPEELETLKLGIAKLKSAKADLLLATDPDVDRLAVVVMQKDTPVCLNGNETACIALEHICRSLKESHKMPPKAMCVKTIVTTELLKAIATHYGVACVDVLTGFKYIGEKIAKWNENKLANVQSHHFLFGGEESYGSLIGTHARDKDAPIFAAVICEAASHLKQQGKTLIDFLYEIYHKYGVEREKLLSLTFEGKEGMEKIAKMMKKLRENPPKVIGNGTVVSIEDYLTHTSLSLATGKKEPIILPKSDVLRFWLDDQTKIVVRPSGTEPKIKIYVAVVDKHSHVDRKAIEKAICHCDIRAEELLVLMKHQLMGT